MISLIIYEKIDLKEIINDCPIYKMAEAKREEALNIQNRQEFTSLLVDLLELVEELGANSQQYKEACDIAKKLNDLRSKIQTTKTYTYLYRTRNYRQRLPTTEHNRRLAVCNRCGRQVAPHNLEAHQKRAICVEIFNERKLTADRGKINAVFVLRHYVKPVEIISNWWIKNKK
jgi:formylmethanofuran dehydrogenase subunit E